MFKKIIWIIALLPAIAFAQKNKSVVNQKPENAAIILKSANDSASYAFGLKIATDLKARGIDSLNYSLWTTAMRQVFSGEKSELSSDQAQQAISNILSAKEKSLSEKNIAEASLFLAENKTKPGVVSLPSGLQYVVLKVGSGPKPTAASEVTVHYKGNLTNGFQFDSSIDRGEPITLNLSGVIPGWTEGLQLMNEGAKFRFFIPWQLGYGANGAGPDIPPYSVLIFEIELLKVGS